LKRILKKYWILFIILLLFLFFIGNYIFSPKIIIINKSNRDIYMYFYQYLGAIEGDKIILADTKSVDMMARGDNRITIPQGKQKILKVNLFDLRSKQDSNNFDLLDFYWKENSSNPNFARYKITDNSDSKSICSARITIMNDSYNIEEKEDSFCFKRIIRIFS